MKRRLMEGVYRFVAFMKGVLVTREVILNELRGGINKLKSFRFGLRMLN